MQVHIQESMLLGRALAAMSHELKNVLAIIGEGAGLMDDIMEIAEEQGCALPDTMNKRFSKALKSIHEQVARGHRLTTDMNRLAHLPDTRLDADKPMVDLGEAANLAMRLTLRRASQGKVVFQHTAATDSPVSLDPQLCLAALLALLEWMLETAEPNSTISAVPVPGTPSLEFVGAQFPKYLNMDVEELAKEAGLEIILPKAGKQHVRVTPAGSLS